MNESQLRAQAAAAADKVAALDWLSQQARNIPTEHSDRCDYMDMTGHPAPCSCGYSKRADVKIINLIREAILKS